MIEIRLADYGDSADGAAVISLLDTYARDPAGGGTAIPLKVLTRLPGELAKRPQAFTVLAIDGDLAIGLVNCIEGFSTFACRPLVNVHDVVVLPRYRGQRVAQLMLERVEEEARARGACKLTLEVLSGNTSAIRAYEREGFGPYALDPAFGTAVFMQKKL
ncbi:GNAT family N-acetyltransferase [Variovorax robiniae]|uniref:GNAT family N-acetyltransferase n=1 Tax=Variovorax robiniae TaxID=1836199 RepID=A0ABU8X997_9BURK